MIYKDILFFLSDRARAAGIHLLQAGKKRVIFAKIFVEVIDLVLGGDDIEE